MENQTLDTKNKIENTEELITKEKNNYLVPVAIVIAGVLIAVSVMYSNQNKTPEEVKLTDNVRPVTSEDHILGSPDADVVIVEYSDFECPFCKRFHKTMNDIMEEYGASGKVAWVYRQFPIDQLHPVKARVESVASECVAEIGGNSAFWKFADRFFELSPSNNNTDIDVVIPQIVKELGIDKQEFDSCMNSGKYDNHIQDDIDNAVETGARGTPWSVIIAKNGKTFPLSGSQPYSTVKQLIEIALKEK